MIFAQNHGRSYSLVSRILALAALLLSSAFLLAAGSDQPFGDNVQRRGSLDNSRIAFSAGKGTVAFLGGSITEMNGYRPMVAEILQKRFPQAQFDFIQAGISSTCSTTGAFRLTTDVLSKPVDLLFVEFAVNDDQDGFHTRAECIRGMEGIIRQARLKNPKIDIVMTFFVNEGMLKTLHADKTPLTIEAHETVAKHYDVSTINLAREAAQEITAGKLTWKQYGGVHPAPFGNAICARMIDTLLSDAWSAPLPPGAAMVDHTLPEPIDPLSYFHGRFIDPKNAEIVKGFTLGVPDWKALPGGKRERFTSIPMLCATEAGAEATLKFTGSGVGAYIVAGPDAGIAEASIDGGPLAAVDLFHHYSVGLHYPRTVMLGTDLQPGEHLLRLRLLADTKSKGHAMRIMEFVAN